MRLKSNKIIGKNGKGIVGEGVRDRVDGRRLALYEDTCGEDSRDF